MSKKSTEILFLGRKSFRMRPKSGDLPRRIKVKLFRWSFILQLNLVELIQERAAVISRLKKRECYGC